MSAERQTIQKQIVYNALCRLANHPTADEIFEEIHHEFPGISRATVYRVLNKLSENGIIAKVRVNNGADHFDHQVFPHYHIRCTKCGRVSDLDMRPFVKIDLISKKSGDFKITGYTLQIDGICPKCQQPCA